MAAKTGQINIVDTLINDYGISPNIEVNCKTLPSKHGYVYYCNTLSLSYLLFQADHEQQIIHGAAGCGQTEMVEHLITKHGISPKTKQSVVGFKYNYYFK